MKKKQTKLRVIALMVMVSLLLGLFPASAFAGTSADNPAAENFGTEGLYVDAPEVLDPRLQNYTIDKLPEELEENLNLDDTALRFDAADAEDPYSITTINSDGTKTLCVFGEPVKYVDEETDKIEFIDTTLTTAKDSDNAYECVTNSKKSYFPKDISKGVLLTNGKRSVTMTPVITETKKNGKIKYKKVKIKGKNHAQYEDVFGKDTSLQYVPTVNGIKENIVLEEYNGTNTFNYVIDAKKLVPKETEGTTITFIDPETEEEVFKIDETFIYDSRYNTENRTENSVSYNNHYTVEEQKNGKYLLTTIVDKAFLESPETVYPVTIDPEIQMSETTQSIITKNLFSSATSVPNGLLRIGGNTDGRVFLKINSNFIKGLTYINPQNITEAFLKMHCDSGSSSFYVVAYEYLLSTSPSTLLSAINYSSVSNSSNLSRISSAQFGTSQYNKIAITSVAKGWISQVLQNGELVNNGIVLAASSTAHSGNFASLNEDGESYSLSPTFQISYFEEHLIEPNVYVIKNANSGYLNKLGEENLTSNLNFVDNPSDSSAWIIQRYGANIGLNGIYMISSYEQYLQSSNGQRKVKYNSGEGKIYAELYRNGDGNEDPTYLWRILSNGDGTYRIMNRNSGNVALSKSGSGVAPSGYNNNVTAAKFTFELYSPAMNEFEIEAKTPSDWPNELAISSSNLLKNRTPLLMEYRAKQSITTTGSGRAYAYEESNLTNGEKMTNGIIDDANVDIRSYTLKEQGESGYMRYIDRNDGRYREKGELYLDLAYDLDAAYEFNTLWLATNTQDNCYKVGAFEVYASTTSGDLFYSTNKVAEFDKCDNNRWSGVVCLALSEMVYAQYVGIRITQGVVKKDNNTNWPNDELEHAYARIRDIALFKREIPVEGVRVNDGRIHLYNDSLTFKAKFTPENATNKNVVWSSKNPDIATINPTTGEVTAVSPGTAEIMVVTEDGGYRATCELTVYVGSGGPYEPKNSNSMNCMGFALNKDQNICPEIVEGSWPSDQHNASAFVENFSAVLERENEQFKILESSSEPIAADEYRIAIRCPNYKDGIHCFHVIYQTEDGNWAGKNHITYPSELLGKGDPSTDDFLWTVTEDTGSYTYDGDTIYFAIKGPRIS